MNKIELLCYELGVCKNFKIVDLTVTVNQLNFAAIKFRYLLIIANLGIFRAI